MTNFPVTATIGFLGFCWICWKVAGRFLCSSPLDVIPGPTSASWIAGNMGGILHRDAWNFHEELAQRYGAACKIYGFLGERVLSIYDPKAMQSVFARDEEEFGRADWLSQWNTVVFGSGLLSTVGAHHRKQRKMLNPLFSTNQMRYMTPIFYDVAERLGNAITQQLKGDGGEIDMLSWMSRTALELVGQAGLGYSFDPLLEEARNDFGEALKRLFVISSQLTLVRRLTPLWTAGPASISQWILDRIPNEKIQELKNICRTMKRESRRIFLSKKLALEKGDEAVAQQIGEGKDILSVLMQANMNSDGDDQLDEDEVISQIGTLVLGATDTTSSGLARILHLLAIHQDVQEKLRSEIAEHCEDQRVPFDSLETLPYLDAVCRETLRLYAPVILTAREARVDTTLPLLRSIRGVDGSIIDNVPVPKGTMVIINLLNSNRDKELWGEDALEWKPERWIEPLPAAVLDAHIPGVYSNLMTFISGSRSCIGFRFSQLEMKIVLVVLIQRFVFSLSKKEIYWNLSGVAYPTVGKISERSCLPLLVEPVRAQR